MLVDRHLAYCIINFSVSGRNNHANLMGMGRLLPGPGQRWVGGEQQWELLGEAAPATHFFGK